MSDRTPEHRRTATGQPNANTDPSNPGTRETPPPVSYVEDGGNASERPNAGLLGDLYAESTDAVYVYDAVTDDWSGFTRFGHAVEVPADAVPLHGRSVAEAEDEVGQVLKANKELRARADAAEAKLKIRDGHHRMELAKAGELLKAAERARDEAAELLGFEKEARLDARRRGTRYRRERDEARENLAESLREYGDVTRLLGEAREKLAEIAAALAAADNDKAVPYEYLTDTVRAVLRDGPPPAEPLTDREEPAQAPEISGAGVPFEQSTGPKRDQCGASSPNGRKQCIRHRGHAGEHMSSVIDTQWASEEPAGETKPERVEWNPTGDTWLPATVIQYRDTPHYLIQLDDGHERLLVEIRHTRPVERQAGNSETKPRERLFGFELPEYIGWTEMNGIYQASCVWDPEKVKFSPLFNEDSTSHLAKFLNLHRHGQPAERQADSETQR